MILNGLKGQRTHNTLALQAAFIATTPSYGHPSSPKEGTTLGVSPFLLPLLQERVGVRLPSLQGGVGVGFYFLSALNRNVKCIQRVTGRP